MNSSTNTDQQSGKDQSRLDRKVAFLQKLPFFQGIPLEIIRLYAYLAEIKEYPANEPIVLEGEKSDRFYLVMTGRVAICEHHHERNFHLQTLSAEGLNYFGELALLAEFDWFFSARALTDVILLSITREAFHKVMEKYPDQLAITVSYIVNLRIKRFIDQTRYLLDHLKEDAWRECGSPE